MRFLRLFCALTVLMTQTSMAAQPWYAETLSAFTSASYIEGADFKAGDFALRAEFVELTLKLLGGKVHSPFGEPVFDDIAVQSPYFVTFQEGARGTWVRGVKSCTGTHPCYAAPLKPVNRAEAAALIVRAFGLTASPLSPTFKDNLPNQWFTDYVTTAASRCILQGDDKKKTVRPGDPMNRAEMLAMLLRGMQSLTYPTCAMTTTALPPAQKEFTLIQSAVTVPAATSAPSSPTNSATSSTSPTPSSSPSAPSVPSVPSVSSVPSASSIASQQSSPSSSSSSSVPSFDFSLLTGSSSSTATSTSSTQDPFYPDLLARFQQYVQQFSDLIARARAADSASALQLLNIMRTQIDLLNELYPYVVYAKSRPLSGGEWSVVSSLETNIRAGFASAP